MPRVYLTVPGVTNSSENHWQSRWEREFPEKFRRIEQAEWDTPVCGDWIAKIESDVQANGLENVVLVAHKPWLHGGRTVGGKIWNEDSGCFFSCTERC